MEVHSTIVDGDAVCWGVVEMGQELGFYGVLDLLEHGQVGGSEVAD